MKKVSLGLVAALALVSSVALADKATVDPDLKISYELPANWKAAPQDPSVTAIGDAADEVSGLLIKVPKGGDPQTAIKQADQVLSGVLSELKKTMGPTTGNINGLEAVQFKAEGKMKEGNEPVRLGEMVLKTPSGMYLIVIIATKTKAFDKHKAEVNKFVMSIKPAK